MENKMFHATVSWEETRKDGIKVTVSEYGDFETIEDAFAFIDGRPNSYIGISKVFTSTPIFKNGEYIVERERIPVIVEENKEEIKRKEEIEKRAEEFCKEREKDLENFLEEDDEITVLRIMGEAEFSQLIKGETLRNDTDHSKYAKSSSSGFCFWPFFVKFWDEDDEIVYVSAEQSDKWYDPKMGMYMVKFRVNRALLNESAGYYPNYFDTWQGVTLDEYCTNKYSRKDFTILGYKKAQNGSFPPEREGWIEP